MSGMFSHVGRSPMVAAVVRATAKHYGLTKDQITSQRRQSHLVLARGVAAWLARKHTNRSLPEIGRELGGRDHTTVLHACRRVEDEFPRNHLLRDDIRQIEAKLAVLPERADADSLLRLAAGIIAPLTEALKAVRDAGAGVEDLIERAEAAVRGDARTERGVARALKLIAAAREADAAYRAMMRSAYDDAKRRTATSDFRQAMTDLESEIARYDAPNAAPPEPKEGETPCRTN